jgi:hypothetical protein
MRKAQSGVVSAKIVPGDNARVVCKTAATAAGRNASIFRFIGLVRFV